MAFPHKQRFSRVWTNIVASPLSSQPVRAAVLETGSVSWRRFPRILTHPQPRPNGPTHCTLPDCQVPGCWLVLTKAGDWGPPKGLGPSRRELERGLPHQARSSMAGYQRE